jgi:hypothetical protein
MLLMAYANLSIKEVPKPSAPLYENGLLRKKEKEKEKNKSQNN